MSQVKPRRNKQYKFVPKYHINNEKRDVTLEISPDFSRATEIELGMEPIWNEMLCNRPTRSALLLDSKYLRLCCILCLFIFYFREVKKKICEMAIFFFCKIFFFQKLKHFIEVPFATSGAMKCGVPVIIFSVPHFTPFNEHASPN